MQNNDDILSAFDIVEDTNNKEILQEEETTYILESEIDFTAEATKEEISVPTPIVENRNA